MSKKRKNYSSAFKAKVALAAIRADETSHTGRSAWAASNPDQYLETPTGRAGRRAVYPQQWGQKDNEHGVDDLHRVIGQLTVERDFLARKLDY